MVFTNFMQDLKMVKIVSVTTGMMTGITGNNELHFYFTVLKWKYLQFISSTTLAYYLSWESFYSEPCSHKSDHNLSSSIITPDCGTTCTTSPSAILIAIIRKPEDTVLKIDGDFEIDSSPMKVTMQYGTYSRSKVHVWRRVWKKQLQWYINNVVNVYTNRGDASGSDLNQSALTL